MNIFKTEEILQFWDEKFSTCVARLSSARGEDFCACTRDMREKGRKEYYGCEDIYLRVCLIGNGNSKKFELREMLGRCGPRSSWASVVMQAEEELELDFFYLA